MFRLNESGTYQRPVEADFPDSNRSGEMLRVKFDATFRTGTREMRDAVIGAGTDAEKLAHAAELLEAVLVDLSLPMGTDEEPIDDPAEKCRIAINHPILSSALLGAYYASLTVAERKRKN